MRASELEHGGVPVLPSEHCEDEDEAIQEVLEVVSRGLYTVVGGVLGLRKDLHAQKDVDEHQEEEQNGKAGDVLQRLSDGLDQRVELLPGLSHLKDSQESESAKGRDGTFSREAIISASHCVAEGDINDT